MRVLRCRPAARSFAGPKPISATRSKSSARRRRGSARRLAGVATSAAGAQAAAFRRALGAGRYSRQGRRQARRRQYPRRYPRRPRVAAQRGEPGRNRKPENGHYIRLDESGKNIMIDETYVAGKLNGVVFYRNTEFQTREYKTYRNGKLNGETKIKNENDIWISDIIYIDDKVAGVLSLLDSQLRQCVFPSRSFIVWANGKTNDNENNNENNNKKEIPVIIKIEVPKDAKRLNTKDYLISGYERFNIRNKKFR